MTPLARLQAAVAFEDYDRPPFADNEWNEMLLEVVPYFAGCLPRADRHYTEAERAAAVRASLDMIAWCHVYDHPRCSVLGELPARREGERTVDSDGFEWLVHGHTEWVARRPFNDLPGLFAYLKRKTDQVRRERPSLIGASQLGSTASPVHGQHLALQAELERLEHARRMLGEVVIAMPYLGLGLDELYRLAGWELLADALNEAPETVAEYLDALAERTIRQVDHWARYVPASQAPVALVYSDIAGNHGLLLSPRVLRLVLWPALKKVTNACHAHGIKVVYHSEGNLRCILDELLETGVDGINPLSPSEHMDAVDIRRRYPRLILWGGIDERAVLACGKSHPEIEREVQRVVEGVGRGLILGSSGGVHPACRAEELIAMVEALHAMG